ncbi:hypothetical protein O6H91_06G018900 [Diphasiastrum complanatum]|uniref:Uncharacterized protein n=1 Tax=Diphasiastrum complanatum TaxID=34168 RepID=A0ACC2DB63_DIPCM|nr:hypothetical protein O6H91_06G018900 [Diphasiastrum complanatum]
MIMYAMAPSSTKLVPLPDPVSSSTASNAEEEEVCLDESFFINEDYTLQTYVIGNYVFEMLCLPSSSTDYDLTGQLLWPGTTILNDYLIHNIEHFQGLTGLLCGHFCDQVVMTDHNDIVLKVMQKNINLQHPRTGGRSANIECEMLDWGNRHQLDVILHKHKRGFDFVLGADICYQQSSLPLLFATVKHLLAYNEAGCKFLLAYVSRTKSVDAAVLVEASKLNLEVCEAPNTRSLVAGGVHEGFMFEISLRITH